MIGAIVLLACSQAGLSHAIEWTRAGDMSSAWNSACAVTDPLEAAQARVYVRQHAGDLEGALREARQGAEAHPGDPWLTERTLSIALSLSRVRTAERALERLESILRDPHVRDREAFEASARAARPETEILVNHARARDRAETRARFVVIGVGSAAILALVWLARANSPSAQRMSSTPAEPTGSNRVLGGIQ